MVRKIPAMAIIIQFWKLKNQNTGELGYGCCCGLREKKRERDVGQRRSRPEKKKTVARTVRLV